jgi:DNA-directed RNA polymerase subunit RPC12/RpoP
MSKIYSIKCSNCSAPLKLIGGGRVQTITCAYCKSVLDLNDNYKVLSNFKKYQEANTLPFKIGMKGVVKNIEYTIIGRVTYREEEPPFSEWSDFLLFSPLYGYAYLSYEEGHLIYSRRERYFPNIEWNDIHNKYLIHVKDEKFEPYDEYRARVVYAEGELTWIAKRGDKTSFIDLISPPYGISAEKTKEEIEFYKTEYLEASMVYDAFNIEENKRIFNDEFNPLKPFNRPILKALSQISLWVMGIIIFLFLAISMDGAGEKITTIYTDNSRVINKPFEVNSTRYLSSIELRAINHKMLSNFNIKINKENKILFSLNGKEAYRFEPNSMKIETTFNHWDKNAKAVEIFLKLKESGIYTIEITPVDKSIKSSLQVIIKDKNSRTNYIQIFLFFTLFTFLIYNYFKWKQKQQLEEERGIHSKSYDSDPRLSSPLSIKIFWVLFLIALSIILSNFE